MTINRFSTGPVPADVRSTFVPLPIDIISQQVDRRQNAYDRAKATLEGTEDAVFGMKGLSSDAETLKGITEGYSGRIDEAISGAGEDLSKLGAFSDTLAREVSRDMKTGHLGAIQNNYARAMKHMEDTTESFKKGNISKAGYNRAMSSISGFGGTKDDGRGGYTRASFYTPTKYLELGETADKYGARIKEQYDAEGARYINPSVAAKQIMNNMWNNPQVIENVKEQIWSAYGDMDESSPQYKAIFQSFMGDIAKSSADKLGFQQVFKQDKIDELTGNVLGTVDVIGSKPKGARFTVGGEDFDEVLKKAKDSGKHTWLQKLEELLPLMATASPGMGGVPSKITLPEAVEASERLESENLVRNDKRLRAAVNEIGKSDLAKDMAQALGIDLDPERITVPQLQSLVSGFNAANNAGVNTRISYSKGKMQEAQFNQLLDNGSLLNKNVINTRTGEPLTYDQKIALFNNHLAKSEDKVGIGMLYGGEAIEGTGQAYGPGTNFFSANMLDGEKLDESDIALYAIESDESSIDPNSAWMQDRMMAAAQSGVSSYNYGGQKVIIRSLGGDDLKIYIDGKAVSPQQLLNKK